MWRTVQPPLSPSLQRMQHYTLLRNAVLSTCFCFVLKYLGFLNTNSGHDISTFVTLYIQVVKLLVFETAVLGFGFSKNESLFDS